MAQQQNGSRRIGEKNCALTGKAKENVNDSIINQSGEMFVSNIITRWNPTSALSLSLVIPVYH